MIETPQKPQPQPVDYKLHYLKGQLTAAQEEAATWFAEASAQAKRAETAETRAEQAEAKLKELLDAQEPDAEPEPAKPAAAKPESGKAN